MGFADLSPQSLSLDEAAASTDFVILTPTELPDGATLVDVLEVQGMVVQRFTLPEGGSFTIAQGTSKESIPLPADVEPIEVRGVSGILYVDENGNRVLLTWEESGLVYAVAGDLTLDQALQIAESLQ